MSATNRLSAIVFTDIVGYTKIMQVDRALGLKLAREHEVLITTLAQQFTGQVINFYGDGSLTLFDSAYSAVSFARALQLKSYPHLPVRIGINDGDVTLEDGKAYGDAINVASRIESSGHSGSILISQSVYKKIRNRGDWQLEKLGKFRLKNVLEPQILFAVQGEGLTTIRPKELSHRVRKSFHSIPLILVFALLLIVIYYFGFNQKQSRQNTEFGSEKSIAVLSFEHRAPSDSVFFAEGIVEDILSQISKIKDVHVMSRYVLKNYDAAGKTPKTIGRELQVKYILSGRISSLKNGLRVSCYLTDTEHEQEVWSESYSVPTNQLLDIQKAVAREVAKILEVHQPSAISVAASPSTINIAAYNLYIKGRSGYYEYDPELNTRAISFFKQALQIDSNYGLAWAALADCLSQAVYSYGTHTPDYLDTSISFASRAIRLSPDEPDTWKALAFAQDVMGNYTDAKYNYRIALEKAPNFSPALINLGGLYDLEGQLVHAIEMYEKSVLINPVHPNPLINLANTQRKLGRYSQALANLKRAEELDPDNWYIDYMFAAIYITQHQFDMAKDCINRFLKKDTSNRFFREVAGELTRYFDPPAAFELFKQSIDDMETASMPDLGIILGAWLSKQRGLPGDQFNLTRVFAKNIKAIEDGLPSKEVYKKLAYIAATRGNVEDSYRWLRKAVDVGLVDYRLLRLEPFFINLLTEQTFDQLVNEIKENIDAMNETLSSTL